MVKTPNSLAHILNYKFSNAQLLERSLTHRSWAHEQTAPGDEPSVRETHNEALEFIGDEVLGLIVAQYLFAHFPQASEGELSRMKHRLVSEETLAAAAERIGLGAHLRFGRGEEKTGGRRKKAVLADALEALFGAISLDGGLTPASAFVERTLTAELAQINPHTAAARDFKTVLQERLQAQKQPPPVYKIIEAAGPPHRRVFYIELSWQGGSVRAQGSTIKAAETEAARLALAVMDGSTHSSPAPPEKLLNPPILPGEDGDETLTDAVSAEVALAQAMVATSKRRKRTGIMPQDTQPAPPQLPRKK